MIPKPLVAASFEPLVLAILRQGETYGYEIIQQIQDRSDGRIQWTASRLYPLLHDLEGRRLLTAHWMRTESGPGRKYYRLTKKGERALVQAKNDWMDVNSILSQFWGPEATAA